MNNYFLIAKILAPAGNGGYVKIFSFSDFPDRFKQLKNVYIDFFGDKKLFSVEKVKYQKKDISIKFSNFNSDSDVEILVGKEVFIDSSDSVSLPADTFFIHDLIGSKVIQNNNELGIITDVLNSPANDIYVIKKLSGEELLIPAVISFIEKFDNTNKVLFLRADIDLNSDDEN
ncbi:MAG: ribosome maturation factor RimM [Bacteroidota bacterium]|nr:ribosome maturation factor RimM [Bacteroidota bacterium]